MKYNQDGIYINTVSGGIVNFGGAIKISPISITNSTSGSGSSNSEPSGFEILKMALNETSCKKEKTSSCS